MEGFRRQAKLRFVKLDVGGIAGWRSIAVGNWKRNASCEKQNVKVFFLSLGQF